MNLRELEQRLGKLTDGMDAAVATVEEASRKTQQLIYELLLDEINKFETTDGRFVVGQNYSARLAIITRKMNELIGNVYKPSIREYLNHYSTVDEVTVSLHKSYNQLQIDKSLLTPAKRIVYDQAEYFLTNGLADAYIQPAKYLLMQQVTQGITLKDAQSVLKNWNDGTLPSGSKLTTSRPTPRLQAYAGQIASDSLFQYSGTIQKIISDEYQLTKGIYVGDIIKDSRAGCKYLVSLKRKIDITEIPDVIKRFPEGTIQGTTMKNFPVYRMGYRCCHMWFPVK